MKKLVGEASEGDCCRASHWEVLGFIDRPNERLKSRVFTKLIVDTMDNIRDREVKKTRIDLISFSKGIMSLCQIGPDSERFEIGRLNEILD